MKIFATRFLETASNDDLSGEQWSWQPENPEIKNLVTSAAPTKSSISTYAADADSHTDSDQPQNSLLRAA